MSISFLKLSDSKPKVLSLRGNYSNQRFDEHGILWILSEFKFTCGCEYAHVYFEIFAEQIVIILFSEKCSTWNHFDKASQEITLAL